MPLDESDYNALIRVAAALERIAGGIEEMVTTSDAISCAVNDFENDDTITKAIERLREQIQIHTKESLSA